MDEKDRCKECMGKKVLEKEKKLEVSIEPGCPNEHDYVFTGESDEYVQI
jgi:DnaJ family protein A protein 2